MSRARPTSRVIVVLGLATLFASLAGAGWLLHARADGGPGPASDATEPEKVICFGYVDVETGVVSLYPLQPGRVERVPVREGQAVRAGEVLLTMDRRATDCLARQARADLAAAVAQRDQARKLIEQQRLKEAEQQAVVDAVGHRLRAAEWLLARRDELRGVQVSDKEVEAARAHCDEVRATLAGETRKLEELRLNDPRQAVARAEAEVSAKQAQLDQAQLALEQCELKAPADGTVLRVLASAGDVLGPQPKGPALVFCPDTPRIVRAEVDQQFAAGVAAGQAALVQDDGGTGPAWHGRVARVSDWYTHRRSILQEPLQLNDVRTLECLIALDPGQPRPRIGQRVLVTIRTAPVPQTSPPSAGPYQARSPSP
jgi:multidrug resistance efflux pump